MNTIIIIVCALLGLAIDLRVLTRKNEESQGVPGEEDTYLPFFLLFLFGSILLVYIMSK